MLAAAVLFAVGYFRYGAIRPAFMAMTRGDLDQARRHFDSIKFPNALSPQSRAYWHWVNAMLAAQDSSNLSFAEEQMQLAVDGALRTSHDRCLAKATLAQIVASNNQPEKAMQLLEEAKQIPHRDSAADYLCRVETELSDSN